ncbi:MAG: glucose-6-phosphate isomerase [Pirellulaceae bacterium]
MSLIDLATDGVFIPQRGLQKEELSALDGRLAEIRDSIYERDLSEFAAGTASDERLPLDTAFVDLPDRLLHTYKSDRDQSVLNDVLVVARRLSELVDRVVVLGIGGSYMGARALMESLCHPYFNELSRGQRGGYPRLYFEGNNVDNDALQGLLDLLLQGNEWQHVEDRWGIVPISKSGGTTETAVAFRIMLAKLRELTGGTVSDYIVPITGADGRLDQMTKGLGCGEMLEVPDGVGGRFSVLSAVGLLPAALLGIDIVRLLEGAKAMNEHFRQAAAAENIVLQFAAIGHLMDVKRNANIRVLSVWSKSLEAIGLWYDQLLAESLGKNQLGATPITTVNTRDLHSRAQQHQQGCYDKLIVNVLPGRHRTDALTVGHHEKNEDRLNDIADKTVPEVLDAAILGVDQALRGDDRPAIGIELGEINPYTVGQLLQMLMLATVVEGRLLHINPYGQPGVQAYKTNMDRNLGR